MMIMGNVRTHVLGTAATATTVGMSVSVRHERRDGDGRNIYSWDIAIMEMGDARILSSGDLDEVRSGVGAPVDALAALDTLLSFMVNDVEVYRSIMGQRVPDDGFMFGDEMAELIYLNDDAVSELIMDVEAARADELYSV